MRKLLMTSTGLFFLCAGASAALAQNNDESTATSTNNTSVTSLQSGISSTKTSSRTGQIRLETITVTADKRKVNLQKAAVDATVLKGEDLKSQGLARIDDIVRGVIGVSTQETQVGPSFYMRGVGDTGQSSSPVAVYVDGVYQDRSEATRGGTLDMAQIEIDRGPQGTSLGANSMAGAVVLESNEPTFTRSGEISITRGNLNHLTVEAVVNQPITDDQAIRIAANTDSQDGIYTSGLENTDNKEARVKYRWRPSGDLNIVATADDQFVYGNNGSGNNFTDENDEGEVVYLNPPTDTVVNNDEWKERGNPWNDGKPYGYYNTFHHTQIVDAHVNAEDNFNWATLTLTPNWEQTHYDSREAQRCFGTSCGQNYQNNFETTESVEAKLASPTTQRFQWIGGLYYYHSSQTGPGGTYTISGGESVNGPPGSPEQCLGLGDTCESIQETKVATVSQEAVYFNTSYSILSSLRVLTGLRFNNENIANQTSGTAYVLTGGSFNDFTYGPDFKRHVNRPDYKISLEYDVTPTSMAYYTFSTGTSLGGVPGAGPPPPGAVIVNYYSPPSTTTQWPEPQELYSDTIGYKSRFLDNTLQFNAELYYQWYNHYSVMLNGVAEIPGVDCASAANLPPGQSLAGCYSGSASTSNLTEKGGDIAITYLPTPNDNITISGGYLDAQWGAQTPNTNFALVNAYLKTYQGAVLQNAPKWQMNATYGHTFSLGEAGVLTPSFNVLAKTTYYSTSMGGSSVNPSGAIQPSYFEYNAYLNYTTLDSKYSVYVFCNNLTNYAVIDNYNTQNGGSDAVDLEPPREYGVTVSAKF